MREKDIKILIADDESAMREVMKIMLSKYTVLEASNGREAIKIFNELKPDLILMDVRMPIMNGIEAAKVILKEHPGTKIVAITAYRTKKEIKMMEAGITDILEKPFRRTELTHMVSRILDEHQN